MNRITYIVRLVLLALLSPQLVDGDVGDGTRRKNLEMSAPDYDELREDGRMVIDFSKRKAMVYTNPYGQVILAFEEDGELHYSDFEPEEIPALIAALNRSAEEAKQIAGERAAEYGAHVAIETAKGGSGT